MKQYYYIKQGKTYNVRVTSHSGCSSETIEVGLTKRKAKSLVDKLNWEELKKES